MVIITAGMIGVGKTTLTDLIAKHLGTQAFFEPVGENPVLPLYYADPKQYGFLLQIYFLNKRFAMTFTGMYTFTGKGDCVFRGIGQES